MRRMSHIEHIRTVLRRLMNAGLTVKFSKCYFACNEIEYLGHKVGLGQVKPKEQKVQALLNATRPISKRQLQSWLGLSGYYSDFIPHYAKLTAPLTNLLSKTKKFVWDQQCEEGFVAIKHVMSSSPVLRVADYSRPFFVFVDACDVSIGAVLMQKDDNDMYHPISYFSKKLNKSQLHYTITDKEALALVLAVRAFRVYMGGSVTVFTDHEALRYIHNNACKNQRLMRWSLELQPYDLTIKHVKGRDNLLADYLSRHVADAIVNVFEVNRQHSENTERTAPIISADSNVAIDGRILDGEQLN